MNCIGPYITKSMGSVITDIRDTEKCKYLSGKGDKKEWQKIIPLLASTVKLGYIKIIGNSGYTFLCLQFVISV